MKNLRHLRESKKITMKELGQIIGVAESTISLYETGKREPDYTTLKRLAKFFNVSTDYLLGLTDNPYFSGGPLAAFIRESRGDESEESFAQRCGISVNLLRRIEEGFRKVDTGDCLHHINSLSTEDMRAIAKELKVDWQYIAALYDGFNPHKIKEIRFIPEKDKTADLSNQILHDAKNLLSKEELVLLEKVRALNPEGQEKLLDYADDLVQSGKYIKSDPSELGAAEGE